MPMLSWMVNAKVLLVPAASLVVVGLRVNPAALAESPVPVYMSLSPIPGVPLMPEPIAPGLAGFIDVPPMPGMLPVGWDEPPQAAAVRSAAASAGTANVRTARRVIGGVFPDGTPDAGVRLTWAAGTGRSKGARQV